MGAIMKLVAVAVVVLVGVSIWKYGFGDKSSSGAAVSNSAIDVTEKDWVHGKTDAPVTLVEYTDFQCPACGAYYPILKELEAEMGDTVRIVIRHYPLVQIHKNALPSARAAEAAGRQGKFWEMYDVLFANQAEWSGAQDPMMSIFPAYAGRIGLNVEQFRKDMSDATLDDKITVDRGTGNELKITGTPSFFLNGEKLENPKSAEAFKKAVEDAAKNR